MSIAYAILLWLVSSVFIGLVLGQIFKVFSD